MADRRRDTLLLLRSRHDGLWLPAGSLTTAAGFVPAERVPCADCGGVLLVDDFGKPLRRRRGRGRVRDRFGRWQECTGCAGVGEVARDPMDARGARVGSAETSSTARPRRTVTCDACAGDGVLKGERCRYCDGAGRRDLHAFELHLDTRDVDERDPVLHTIEARAQAGSYRELDRALARLDRPARVALLAAVDAGELWPVPDAVAPALAFVVALMPDPIRVPALVRANGRELAEWRKRVRGRGTSVQALELRDREIREAVRKGRPTQRVAFEHGLSVSQVNRILGGGSERVA